MSKITQFFNLLWSEYNYQLILVTSTLISLITESLLAPVWSAFRLIPQGLLMTCILYFVYNTYKILKSIKPAPQVAYSICVGKASYWFDSFARRQQEAKLKSGSIRWEDVKRIYRIHDSDWVFLSHEALGENINEWLDVTQKIFRHFWSLMKRVEEVPIHHFFFIAPPSLTFAFGAYIGRKVPNRVYHHVGNIQHPYLLVSDTTKRDTSNGLDSLNKRIKETEFKNVHIERNKGQGNEIIIIVLDFTNHKINSELLDENQAIEIVKVEHRNGIGHIPTEGWEELAKEIASLILRYSDENNNIEIYVNTPLPLAFIVGSIVGPIKGIIICEYNIYLKKLCKCIDLGAAELQSLNNHLSRV